MQLARGHMYIVRTAPWQSCRPCVDLARTMGCGAAKPAGSSFLTPGSGTVRFGGNAGGFKKSGVGGVKSGLGPGQTSLFGFFKTPAPAADQERPRAVNTPTTGDFIAM